MPYGFYMRGPGSGYFVGGFILMLIFWGVLALLVLVAIRHFSHHHDVVPPASSSEPAAVETLKMRLARGEIDVEEFQRRLDLIRNTK